MLNLSNHLSQSPRIENLRSNVGVAARVALTNMVVIPEMDVDYKHDLSQWAFGITGTIELRKLLERVGVKSDKLHGHNILADLDAAQCKA